MIGDDESGALEEVVEQYNRLYQDIQLHTAGCQ